MGERTRARTPAREKKRSINEKPFPNQRRYRNKKKGAAGREGGGQSIQWYTKQCLPSSTKLLPTRKPVDSWISILFLTFGQLFYYHRKIIPPIITCSLSLKREYSCCKGVVAPSTTAKHTSTRVSNSCCQKVYKKSIYRSLPGVGPTPLPSCVRRDRTQPSYAKGGRYISLTNYRIDDTRSAVKDEENLPHDEK